MWPLNIKATLTLLLTSGQCSLVDQLGMFYLKRMYKETINIVTIIAIAMFLLFSLFVDISILFLWDA